MDGASGTQTVVVADGRTQHGEWLARNVPNAEVVIDEQGGHFPTRNLVMERFTWLVQPV